MTHQIPKSYLDEFDPNAMPEPYATYTHGRTPFFKLHSKLSHATAACTNNARSGVILYERQGGQWVQIARFEQNYVTDPAGTLVPHRCDGCGRSTIRSHRGTGDPVVKAKQRFVRDHNGRLAKPLQVETLCSDCTYIR